MKCLCSLSVALYILLSLTRLLLQLFRVLFTSVPVTNPRNCYLLDIFRARRWHIQLEILNIFQNLKNLSFGQGRHFSRLADFTYRYSNEIFHRPVPAIVVSAASHIDLCSFAYSLGSIALTHPHHRIDA